MMKKLTHIKLSLSLTLLTLPSLAFAGAWTPQKGEMYNKFAINYFFSDSNFDSKGNRIKNSNGSEFIDRNFSYYMERGLRDNLALFGSIAAKSLESKSNSATQTTIGVGDLDLGLRYRLIEDPVVLSVSLLGKFPYLYDKNDNPPVGNGQEDGEFRLLLGKGFGKYGYAGIEAGYRYRAREPSDEFRYLLEYGFSPTQQIYLRTKLAGIKSAKNADKATDTTGNPLLGTEADLGQWELTAGYALGQNWFGEITNTTLVYGKNSGAGNNIQTAVIYRF